MRRNRTERAEYGDFQTPQKLADTVCRLLAESVPHAATIIEPTCGIGNFLFAALKSFPSAQRAIGADINPQYIAKARQRAESETQHPDLIQLDFFDADWPRTLLDCAEPILVIGNPPWVTNTHLSKLGSDNMPQKSNENRLSGYDAISGKSNFDISEWMLVRLLDSLNGRNAVLAMLCKTAVARKVLAYAWRSGIQLQSASMRLFDAQESFSVSVDACLFVCVLAPASSCDTCTVFPSLSPQPAGSKIGYLDGFLIADVDKYLRRRALLGPELYRWRSGLKHDCSAVMELRPLGSSYINGLHEKVDVEPDYLFPLFKSSDIANGRIVKPKRYVLVTQTRVGEDTHVIKHIAPKTWSYLEAHASRLDSRRSTIYAKQPRFAVFGIGDYSFAPWKVAVSGLYKRLAFRVIPPFGGKPSMLDDTCYFLSCDSEEEAVYLKGLLDSEPAQEFYESFLFPDSKRPVTVDLLRRLDLLALAGALEDEERMQTILKRRRNAGHAGENPALAQGVLLC